MNMVNKRIGFTLIELLVVIAIIAILAAILFPVFAKVREKARQTSCLSNEKQLGLGFMQYYQDYDEKYPCGKFNGGHYGSGWGGQIYSYVKSVGVFKCPDDSSVSQTSAPPTSYMYNLNIGEGHPDQTYTNHDVNALTDADFTSTSKTVLLCENFGYPWPANLTSADEGQTTAGNGVTHGATGGIYKTGYMGGRDANNVGYESNGCTDNGTNWGLNCFQSATGIHNEGSNFVLADGHAKWLRGPAVSSGLNAAVGTNDQGTGCTQAAWGSASCQAAGADFSGTSAATGTSFSATFSVM